MERVQRERPGGDEAACTPRAGPAGGPCVSSALAPGRTRGQSRFGREPPVRARARAPSGGWEAGVPGQPCAGEVAAWRWD